MRLPANLLSQYPSPPVVVVAGAPAAPTPSPIDEMSGSAPLSLGCYEDVGADRIMDDLALVDYSMTTEVTDLFCVTRRRAPTSCRSWRFSPRKRTWCHTVMQNAHKHVHSDENAMTCVDQGPSVTPDTPTQRTYL